MPLVSCRIIVDGTSRCNEYIHKCKYCGATGCDNDACRNQNFEGGNGLCLSCGSSHARV